MSDINNIQLEKSPFLYGKLDNFLDASLAKDVQKEILSIPQEAWDRYDNPFEQKYTLRDKFGFPPHLKSLFNMLTTDSFVSSLERITGHKLVLDITRNFWGVYIYKSGDKLDIHVDAGMHPSLNLKKQLTLGIYLSHEWKEEYGCSLEIWKGDNCSNNTAKISEKVCSIPPIFNRLILFDCDDYSWHENPEPAKCPDESKRIFVTISYLSENFKYCNKRKKAFFIARPQDPVDTEKDKLRLLRADAEMYKTVYRI